ncbi:hypothetical protein E4U42_007079 [Claviceps africana]|uniref:Uncharacterized protein n=1 Tax=Claviceps africana TaxID=83212 RepID=A0A8K0J275_9HYPO|nr:hypothetical protein E4U42_007079 [Claviceps africana]
MPQRALRRHFCTSRPWICRLDDTADPLENTVGNMLEEPQVLAAEMNEELEVSTAGQHEVQAAADEADGTWDEHRISSREQWLGRRKCGPRR